MYIILFVGRFVNVQRCMSFFAFNIKLEYAVVCSINRKGSYTMFLDNSFLTSITKNTDDVISKSPARSPNVKASVWKMYCNGGKYITASCPIMLSATASQNTVLLNIPMSTIRRSWDLDERAFHISKNTKQVNVIVTSLGLVLPSSANDWK